MRLIDADAFKQQLAAIAMRENYPVEKVNALIKLIDMQPTVSDMANNIQTNEKST